MAHRLRRMARLTRRAWRTSATDQASVRAAWKRDDDANTAARERVERSRRTAQDALDALVRSYGSDLASAFDGWTGQHTQDAGPVTRWEHHDGVTLLRSPWYRGQSFVLTVERDGATWDDPLTVR